MRYFLGFNPKLSASKFKNAPVSRKKKLVIAPPPHGSPVVMYKMSAGPLKENTVERDMRKAKEAKARWEARQAEKEARQAEKEAKEKSAGPYKPEPRCRKAYYSDPERKARAKLMQAVRKEKLTEQEKEAKRLKQNAYYYNRRARLRAEAKGETYQSQNDWAYASRVRKLLTPEQEAKRLKLNEYQNARNARLRAEAKKKSTSVVITITITDPNKS